MCADRTAARSQSNLAKQYQFHLLSVQQVQALLTFFSKSFSHFPHGTCLLSISNPYLALDEIYHPLCAPSSRNTNPGSMPCTANCKRQTGISPSMSLHPKSLPLHSSWHCILSIQFIAASYDFQCELFLVHSPLLQESCSVFGPPLTYMLKFSRFA